MNIIHTSVRWSSNNFRLCSCGHQLFQQLVSFQGAEELFFHCMFVVPIINITLFSNVIGLKDHVVSTYAFYHIIRRTVCDRTVCNRQLD